jgi:hypothetical protein
MDFHGEMQASSLSLQATTENTAISVSVDAMSTETRSLASDMMSPAGSVMSVVLNPHEVNYTYTAAVEDEQDTPLHPPSATAADQDSNMEIVNNEDENQEAHVKQEADGNQQRTNSHVPVLTSQDLLFFSRMAEIASQGEDMKTITKNEDKAEPERDPNPNSTAAGSSSDCKKAELSQRISIKIPTSDQSHNTRGAKRGLSIKGSSQSGVSTPTQGGTLTNLADLAALILNNDPQSTTVTEGNNSPWATTQVASLSELVGTPSSMASTSTPTSAMATTAVPATAVALISSCSTAASATDRSGPVTRGFPTSKKSTQEGRVFSCSFTNCSYKSNRSSNVITHERTHTGERPFVCEYPGCDYSATHKSNLKVHLKLHGGLATSSPSSASWKKPQLARSQSDSAFSSSEASSGVPRSRGHSASFDETHSYNDEEKAMLPAL